MPMHPLQNRILAFAAGAALLAFSGWASADPPSRAARLGYLSGAVSFSPAGESDWVQATVNRPLTTGDRLWTDAQGRAEIQFGGSMIRLGPNTGVSILNLDDRIAQLQLSQGSLIVRVRSMAPNQVVEVDTPNLAFTLRKPGEYRVGADPAADSTDIIVRKGQGEAYGEGAAYLIDARQPYRFRGTGLRDYQLVQAPYLDDLDRWAASRDRVLERSTSARYVSPEVVGYQDLDSNGIWRTEPGYGNVWVPSRVASGWVPYRDGHWSWIDPWGWTWVDDAPWGYAVSHYGRWAHRAGDWFWVPGPVRTRAYYAPALVAFVGGNNFQLTVSSGNVGGVAWFPLAPREVYRPAYAVSNGYFQNINRSNTVVNNTVINNYYNNSTNVTQVVYANRQVPGAVVAVPRTAFAQSQQVARAVVAISRETLAAAPIVAVAAVAPTAQSVHGAAVPGTRPPEHSFRREVVARTAPPAAHTGFAAQRQQLAANPGQPLTDAARRQLMPAAAQTTPAVTVVAQPQTAAPTVRPPPQAPGPRDGERRGRPDEGQVPALPALPGAATGSAAPINAASRPLPGFIPPQPPVLPAPRAMPSAPPLPQRVLPVPAPVVTPQVTPTLPAFQSSAPRGRSDNRGDQGPRDQAERPAPAPMPPAVPARLVPAPASAPLVLPQPAAIPHPAPPVQRVTPPAPQVLPQPAAAPTAPRAVSVPPATPQVQPQPHPYPQTAPMPQRAPEPRPAPQPVAPSPAPLPAIAPPAPPPRPAPPVPAPVPQPPAQRAAPPVAIPVPAPAPAAAPAQGERRQPGAAPGQAQPASRAESPRVRDRRRDGDEPRREEDGRKP